MTAFVAESPKGKKTEHSDFQAAVSWAVKKGGTYTFRLKKGGNKE